jgi:hypothetical protein
MCKRHVQLPRQVVKKLARHRNATTLLWVCKILRHLGQKGSNKHRTIVHPKKKKRKKEKEKKGVMLTPLLMCVLHLSQHTELYLIDCRASYTLGDGDFRSPYTQTHTLKEVLVIIIIIRVERRPNII